ncbi:restriction endonuclease subunit S, partial [Salmonella enterica subsp. enterica serovar Muenchen]|nr:restriction endonuclease subunit S [Salmonella enterica subsp. enterica serovar Muenchen]ECT5103096.1 restriction endonuclease subunit S [Salmonella enterica subsp. enterica serovar Muenchen]
MAVEKLIVDHIDTWTTALQTRSTAGRGSSGKIDLYGIKKLRELILELAVRGKLVPQDPNDEPASVLLERIAAEKAELVKQGKIKKQKPLPEISEEEKSFELPVGWEWTTLNTLAEINPKIDVSDDEQDISFVPMPLISTKFDGSHDFEVRKWKEVKKGYTHFANGDIAIAKITPCFENSKAAIFSGLKNNVGVGTTELHVARPYSQAVNQQYLLLNFKSPGFLKTGESQMTGSAGQKRVPRNFFENYPLPFPPLQEQERIVNNFTQLMILCDQLEQHSLTSLDAHQQLVETLLTTLTDSQNADELAENWARISEHFDTLFTTEASIAALKQTILQLAVMGKLVPQDPNDEPASELLKRIAQEKAQLVKDGKMKKQKPLPPISDEEKPFELPIGWEWCRLGECINLISGQHLKPDEYEEECHGEMLPYITGPAEFGLISPTYSKYTNEKRAIAAKGDILITCKGAGLGKLNVADTNIAISRQLMAINVIRMNSEYLKIILDSMYGYFQSKGVGIAIPGISREDVMEPLIMLPPFEEQKRIMENLYKLNFLIEDIK